MSVMVGVSVRACVVVTDRDNARVKLADFVEDVGNDLETDRDGKRDSLPVNKGDGVATECDAVTERTIDRESLNDRVLVADNRLAVLEIDKVPPDFEALLVLEILSEIENEGEKLRSC